jgi:hypothetical protein
MVRNGLTPPPPEELQGMDLKVEYISVMAQAQRAIGTSSLERISAFVGNLAAAKPEVLDKLDTDQLVDQYAEMLGVPPKVVIPDGDVEVIRAQRAQAQQQQMQMEQMQQAAQGAKTLSEADTGNESVLSSILGGMGGPMGPAQ